MYPPNINYNTCNDLISYSEQAFLELPNLNIISNSIQEDPSPLCFLGHFSPFSSPSIDGNVFLQSHHDHDINRQISTVMAAEQIPRKRNYKGDRHSKINTARGPRDRRMRLSLEVARKFFGLQDMLGFDKASKTVEWLLLQAKVEIKKLAMARDDQVKRSCSVGHDVKTSASSTSECGEVLSGIDEVVVFDHGNQQGRLVSKEKPSAFTAAKEKKNIRQWRKSAFHDRPLARESRDQARARARERTKEKLRTRGVDESKSCDLSRLRLWSLLEETGEESAGTQSHNMNPNSMEVLLPPEIEEESSHAGPDDHHDLGVAEDMVNDDSLVIIGRWSPSLIFDTVNINTGISQEHHDQFTDFQLFGKPCEACNINI